MLTLNPAYTGDFDGAWRINANNRNQWTALKNPFNTASVYFEAPVYLGDTRVNLGGGVVHDETGSIHFQSNKISLSLSMAKKIANNHNIRVGAQIGYSLKNADSELMTFPNQYDGNIGDFNSSLASNEVAENYSISYLDINVGAIWNKKYEWGKPEVGAAFYHVNFPKENFYDNSERLTARTVFHASIEKTLTEKISVVPRTLFMYHNKAINFNLGAEARYSLELNKAIKSHLFFGAYLRNNISTNSDALIFNIGMKYSNVLFGISYDVNISKLNVVTNYNGAIEFALIYTLDYDKYDKYTIPCERY